MRAALTDEERNDLSGIIKWHMNCYGSDSTNQSWKSLCIENVNLSVERIVAAHVRRALEDAAAATYSEHFESWLRARAAATAPDPRETKD